jgi:hypothetical protein
MIIDTLDIVPASGDASRTPGSTVELIATWAMAKTPTSLEARLFWFTLGKGTPDTDIVATTRIAASAPSGERRVRFLLPMAPYSFSGRLISLIWSAELVADETEGARWEFVLAPDGKEILLHKPYSYAPRPR